MLQGFGFPIEDREVQTILSGGRIWDFRNQPGTKNQTKTRFHYKAKPNNLGIWFSLAWYPSPVLKSQPHVNWLSLGYVFNLTPTFLKFETQVVVITRISGSVNIFPAAGFGKNLPGTKGYKNTRFQCKAKPLTLRSWFSLAW